MVTGYKMALLNVLGTEEVNDLLLYCCSTGQC